MSQIDRFLLSERWCLTWPNCFQMASSQGLSDHCPIQLCIDFANWGPKLVRMLKCWESFTGYNSFVREKWSTFLLEGWVCIERKIKVDQISLKGVACPSLKKSSSKNYFFKGPNGGFRCKR